MAHIQARIPQEHYDQLIQLGGDRSSHVKAAIALYVDSFRSPPNVERTPTPKKQATWKPLSAHTRSRMQVLRSFDVRLGGKQTSSDAAHTTGQNTNNAQRRLAELAAEGYIVQTGEYRKSRDSGKMLTLWQRTSKPLPEELI